MRPRFRQLQRRRRTGGLPILLVGAILVDLTWSPPWWVHLVWIPVGLALTVGGLRTAKAWLIAQEFVHRAREGKIAP